MAKNSPPFPDAGQWVRFLSEAKLPILRYTARQLEEAREKQDRINARDITAIVLQDPLLMVRVLAYIQPYISKTLRSEITTVGGAVMMLGVEPFFQRFSDLPTLENTLSEEPQALLGALQVTFRVQRAASYAQSWALWRHDLNIEEVTIAALLHDLAEILCWTFAPRLAIEIRNRLRRDKTLRSARVQQEILGVSCSELQRVLCRAWALPKLLQTLIDDTHADHPRVRNVILAVDLARHSADGWNNAALPDDFTAIERLLKVNRDGLIRLLGLTDDQVAMLPAMSATPPPGD
ncbi:MAG: HDOD domain-containing protein [Betaproteobacteria bacterium]|nr:HDOD domain-containing protein [Betaproteobacteria bacterium]